MLTDFPAQIAHLPMRLSGNQLAYTVEAADETYTDRNALRYRLELFVPEAFQSGAFASVLELDGAEQPPVQQGGLTYWPGCDFDLGSQDDLNGVLESYLDRCVPDPAQTELSVCPDLVRPYYVKTRFEEAGTPLGEKTLPVEYVLKGRLDTEQFPGWKDLFFTTYLDATRKFLTWQPQDKLVDRQQPEFLYFLVNFTPAPTLLTLRCRVYYADGSGETYTVRSLANVGQYQVYGVPVGVAALGLAAKETAAGKEAFRYEVWLNNQDGHQVSEVRRYLINRAYQRNVRYLLFANSLGGFDTLRCTGQVSESIALTTRLAQQPLETSYLPASSEVFVTSKTGDRLLTVATGLRDGDEVNYLAELAYSPEVYVLTAEGLVSLVATEGGFALRSTDENLSGRVFQYRYSKTQRGYSDLPAAPIATTRPTYWQPIQPYCLIDETTGLRNGYQGAARLQLYYADTNTTVPGLRPKPNVPGTAGYFAPVLSPSCAASTTPYKNVEIAQQGTFAKNNCGGAGSGTTALVTIPAGVYGSETSLTQANQRAQTAWDALNTQAYANTYGSCLAGAEFYSMSGIPALKINVRFAPGMLSTSFISGGQMMDSGNPADETHGNGWPHQYSTNPASTIYPPGTNDLKLPQSYTAGSFTYRVYLANPVAGTLKGYVNGVLRFSIDVPFNVGYTRPDWGSVAAGDRIYLEFV